MNSQALRSSRGERVPAWTVSDRLRKAREAAGLDQHDLAEVTGISRATISNYERGRTEPSRASLNLWALATGVPSAWIRDGEYTPRDLNPEPTVSGIGNVASIDSARSMRDRFGMTRAEVLEDIAPASWSTVEPPKDSRRAATRPERGGAA